MERPARADRRRPDPWLLGVAALTALAAALRFSGLGDQSLWYDEYLSRRVVAAPLADVLGNVRASEANPPLYYWALWAWRWVFGDSDFALRSLSAMAGTLSVPVAFLVGREAAGRRAGVILAALVATSPWLVWYSQEMRNYSLLFLLGGVTLWLFLRSHRKPTAPNLAAWALAAALAIATHYFAVVLIVAEAVMLAALCPGRRRAVGLASLLPAATLLALAPLALDHRQSVGWIETMPLSVRLSQVAEQFAVGNGDPPAAAALVIAAAVAAGLAGLWRGDKGPWRVGAALLAGAVGLSALVLAATVLAGDDLLIARNLIVVWLPAAGVVAIGLSQLRPRWAGVAVAVACCTLSVALTIQVAGDWSRQRIDWRLASDLVGEAGSPRLLVVRGGYQAEPLLTYLPGTTPAVDASEPLRELVVLDYEEPSGAGPCWFGAACAMPSAEPPIPVPAGARPLARRGGEGFTAVRYRLPRARALEDPSFRGLLTTVLRNPNTIRLMEQRPAS